MKRIMLVVFAIMFVAVLSGCDLFGGRTQTTQTTTEGITTTQTTTEGITTTQTTRPSTTLTTVTTTITHTVTFDAAGGTDVPAESVNHGAVMELPVTTREGYVFDGWMSGDVLFSEDDPVTSDLTLTAGWTPVDYTLVFEENGGSEITDLTQAYQSDLAEPAAPDKLGYVFDGWYGDEGLTLPFVFDVMPLGGATIYAKWTPALVDVTINHHTEDLTGGTYTLTQTITVTDYTESTHQASALDLAGFSYDDGHVSDESVGVVLADGSLVLDLYYTRDTVTMSFETDADFSVSSFTQKYGSTVNPPEDPTRLGYTFLGWFADRERSVAYVFATMPADDVTVYAGWRGEPSTIHFITDGGGDIDAITAENGTEITLPVPVKEGHDFLGWYVTDTLTTRFTDTVMPVGGHTLYAKWEKTEYTLSFEENGGTDVADVLVAFDDPLSPPAHPTRTDYVFAGWFTDAALTDLFVFSTMPAHDVTLYAKWADITDPYAILLNTVKPSGTDVTIRGIVYQTMGSDYTGFMIADDTGFVYVDATHTGLSAGDVVEVAGTLIIEDHIPMIRGVSDIQTLGTDAVPITATLMDLVDVDALMPSATTVHNLYRSTGLLFYDSFDGHYYLVDPATETHVRIALRSYGSDRIPAMEAAAGDRIILDYALVWKTDHIEAALVSLTADPYSEADIVALLQAMAAEHLSGLVFKSGDVFQIPEGDPYGLTSFDVEVIAGEAYYDLAEGVFLDIADGLDKTVTFRLTFTVNGNPYTVDFDVTVKPVVITTIAELIAGETGNYYEIEATVVSYSEFGLMILKDDTGTVFAEIIPGIEIGDLVRLSVRRDMHQHMVMLYAENDGIRLNRVVSKANDLNLTLEPLSTADVLALDPTDPTIYGRYVEIRGFLLTEHYHFNTITTDDYAIKIEGFSHSGFEKLMDYQYLDIHVRGYLFTDDDGHIMLFYEGIRRDIRIPEYTDQERVDVIAEILDHMYAGRSFDAFDYFEPMPFHRVLGGTIGWAMDGTTASLYDVGTSRFKQVLEDTQLSFTITISEGSAQTQLVFTPMLNGIRQTAMSDLKQPAMYGDYFVRGLVAYWHPEYTYLMDEATGELLYLDMELRDVRKGDIIIVYGAWRMGAYDGGEVYLGPSYDDIPPLVMIISRENPVTLTAEPLASSDLHQTDPYAIDAYTRYVEMEGRLIKIDDYAIVLRTPEGDVYLDYVDEYTYYELDRMQDRYVTIRGFVSEYDDNYAISDEVWHLRFVGSSGDLEATAFTDEQKNAIMKQYILDEYQTTVESDTWFDFTGVGVLFPDVTFSYTEITDPEGLLDLSGGYDGYLGSSTVDTDITLEATLDANGTVDTFRFTFTVLREDVSAAVSITDALAAPGETHMVEGMVIALLYDDGEYVLLIEDVSGRLYVRIDYQTYQASTDYNYIGDRVRVEGTIATIGSRHEMMPTQFSVIARNAVCDPSFAAMTLIDLDNLDMTLGENIGLPVTLSGWVERDEDGDYFVSNGNERIDLINGNYYLNRFIGYPVIIRGFMFDDDAVLVYEHAYGGVSSMHVDITDDDVLVNLVFDAMMQNVRGQHNRLDIIENRYHDFPGIPNIIKTTFPGMVLEVTVLDHEEAFNFMSSGIYYIHPLLDDVTVTVRVTLSYNAVSRQGTYELELEGFETKTLADLFAAEAGTPEIILKGIYLHSGWGFTYFLIDGDVYYLENFAYGWFETGDEVYLKGKKTMIDGIPDYTFDIYYDGVYVDYGDPMEANMANISFPVIITEDTDLDFAPDNGNYYYWIDYAYDVSDPSIIDATGQVTVPIGSQSEVTITVTATHDTTDPDTGDPLTLMLQKSFVVKVGRIDMTLAELYAHDFDATPLNHDLLTVFGKLGYDRYMDMYTLTDGDDMIYIRLSKDDYGDSPVVLWDYLGEYVLLDVMLPMKTVRGDYILVDSLGGQTQVRMATLSRQEEVDLVAEQILTGYGSVDVMAGDELSFLPMWHNHHSVLIEYTLDDPLDEAYVDLDGMYTTYVATDRTIAITVHVTHQEDIDVTATVTITLTIHPHATTDISGVLWGYEDHVYQIEGTVVALVMYDDSSNYNYMIVEDATGRIFVGLNSIPYGLYGGESVVLAEGDQVRLIATRCTYDNEGIIPVMDNLAYVEVLAHDDLILPSPEVVTFEDLMALDYLAIDTYYHYVRIEETLQNVGSTYYPSYVLEDDAFVNSVYGNYYHLLIEGTDLTAALGGDLNLDIILDGYLAGFDKGFDFYWVVTYMDHTLPVV